MTLTHKLDGVDYFDLKKKKKKKRQEGGVTNTKTDKFQIHKWSLQTPTEKRTLSFYANSHTLDNLPERARNVTALIRQTHHYTD